MYIKECFTCVKSKKCKYKRKCKDIHCIEHDCKLCIHFNSCLRILDFTKGVVN